MNYDLTKKKLWRPLFTSESKTNTFYEGGIAQHSKQPATLHYLEPMGDEEVANLTDRLQKSLIERF